MSLKKIRYGILACERCPRLRAWCEAVAHKGKPEFRGEIYHGKPVPGFGDPKARLLVVGLAPAAHGANRTGRIFTGDSSGDWLYEALHRYGFANQPHSIHREDGLKLTDCYVTAAARCAPPDNKPTREEFDACRPWLESELAALTRVRVIVALGRLAQENLEKIFGRRLSQFGHGATTHLPDGRIVIASYHPSRQNTNTGKLTRAMWHSIFEKARCAYS